MNNRLSLIMSSLTLVIAVGGVGGPAIARAIAPNADKVDGFHAVGAHAPGLKRTGRLVATDDRGWLPVTAVNPASAFPARVPPAVTVRGSWFVHDQDLSQVPGVYWATGISFPARIDATLTPQYVGNQTAQCPGTAAQPEAAPGYLCLYIRYQFGVMTPQANTVEVLPYGAELSFVDDSAKGWATIGGTWAATTPD